MHPGNGFFHSPVLLYSLVAMDFFFLEQQRIVLYQSCQKSQLNTPV